MFDRKSILEIKNLEIGYPISKGIFYSLFSGINLTASKGELIAIVGKNGIGKSTLLRSIAGLQQSKNGQVTINNKLIGNYSRSEFAGLVSFVSTEIVHVNNLSVFDLVALGRFPHTNWFGKLEEKDIVAVNNALEMVGMTSFANKNINEISDGERQRVMIARTLAQDTQIIILDEPTAFLDLPNKYEIVHLLNNLAKTEGKTIIFSTHDLNIAIQEVDKIWLMLADGVKEGAPEDLILNETFNHLFEHTRLNFDKVKGDFKMKRQNTKKIGLIGDGIDYTWTKKALERLNFSVEKGNDSIICVTINQENWQIKKDGNNYFANSIYELSNILRNTDNN
ncbi:MAG: ABC transporter ATP-binding protein [Bacteroidales bacterium]